jgi:hypothetical protein
VTTWLGDIVSDFADAFKAVDETRPQGPLEPEPMDLALVHLQKRTP